MSGTKLFTKVFMPFVLFACMTVNSYSQWNIGGNNFAGVPNYKLFGSKNCYEVKLMANSIENISLRPDCLGGGGITFSNSPRVLFSSSIGEVDMGQVSLLRAPGGTLLDTDSLGGARLRTDIMAIGNVAPTINNHTLDVYASTASMVPVLYTKAVITSKINSLGIQSYAVPPIGNSNGYGYAFYGEGGKLGLYAKGNGNSYSGSVYGSYNYATGSSANGYRYGNFGYAFGGKVGYGIYSLSDSATTNYAAYLNGNVTVTGQFNNASDIKLKENIEPYYGALEKINALSVKTYTFKNEYSFMHFPQGKQVGLIAQELEKVFPSLVSEQVHPPLENPATGEIIHPAVNYKGVCYIGLIPVTIEAIQEQQKEIISLKESLSEIQHLKNENSQLRNELDDVRSQLSEIKLALTAYNVSKESVIQQPNSGLPKATLGQNVPNPFKEFTEINFIIPQDGQSNIDIYNESNEFIRSVSVSHQYSGKVRIDSSGLSAGTYRYDLVVNGKITDSKRFIILK